MKPDELERLKAILAGAAERPPEARGAFLDQACAGDRDLRREIERMLADPERVHHLMQLETATDRSAGRSEVSSWIGRTIGRYEIIGTLGQGGMGWVFRARDLELDREVALKCLAPDLAADPECRRRFLQEGRAASKVSHPNIVQVFEAFEADGHPWLAMQLVPGRDLGSRLAERGRLSIETVLRYAEDLASALRVAHSHGILHRDIKPANVLIDADDRALLSDFGLARVRSAVTAPDSTEPTTTMTPPGAVLGTPRYMSPEQVLGRATDERSDVFSLGVVLYEMCTGVPAFSESSRGSLSDAIVHREPEPIARFTYEIPEDLERIIRKAMSKPPEERYQNGGEILIDIRAARRKHEFGAYAAAHPEPSRTRVRRLPLAPIWVLLFILAAAVLVGRWIQRNREAPIPNAEPVRVTSVDGWEGQPAIAPDGGRIAYVADAEGNDDLYLVDAQGGVPVRLTDEPSDDRQPAWFPDGRSLAFVSDRSGCASIWRTGQLGGGATLLIPDAEQPAISPDGRRIAFCRAPRGADLRIAVASLEDPSRIEMLTDDNGGLWAHEHPAWSPDGARICYATRHGLWEVPSGGGLARRLTVDTDLDQDPVWSPSGRHVYFSSWRDGTIALWRVRAAGGVPERVTLGDSRQCQPSLSRDGRRMAYATQVLSRNLVFWNFSTRRETIVRVLSDAEQPAMSPDGQLLAFVSPRGGKNLDIWLQPMLDGLPNGLARQLTSGPGDAGHPAFSPDGERIVYYQIIGQDRDLWVIPARGGQPIKLTENPASDMQPSWSPDGRRIAFVSERDGHSRIWTVPASGERVDGTARRIEDEAVLALAPEWSPDGRWIAFVGSDSSGNDAWLAPADGFGRAVRLTNGAGVTRLRWGRDSGHLIACGSWGERHCSFREVSTSGDQTRAPNPPITAGPSTSIPTFDISADGRTLVTTREEIGGDIWLLKAVGGPY